MSKFKKLNMEINNVLDLLLKKPNLLKLLNYTSDSPLQEPNVNNPKSLLFKNIFPYPFIPEAQEHACSVLSILFDNFRPDGNSTQYQTNGMTFLILCHIDLWKVENGLRPIYIMDEIADVFDQTNGFGIGKLTSRTADIYWANNKYVGYRITYQNNDFK